MKLEKLSKSDRFFTFAASQLVDLQDREKPAPVKSGAVINTIKTDLSEQAG